MNWLSPISSHSVISYLCEFLPERWRYLVNWQKLDQKPVRLESPSSPGHQPCFLKTFRHIEDDHITHELPFIRKGFKMRTIFVPVEIPQPDLALHRDALELMSEEVSPDALCTTSSPRQMWPRTSCCHFLPKTNAGTCFSSLSFPYPPQSYCPSQPPPPCRTFPGDAGVVSYCGNRCWLEGRVSLLGWAGGGPTVELPKLEEWLRAQGSRNGDVLGYLFAHYLDYVLLFFPNFKSLYLK